MLNFEEPSNVKPMLPVSPTFHHLHHLHHLHHPRHPMAGLMQIMEQVGDKTSPEVYRYRLLPQSIGKGRERSY